MDSFIRLAVYFVEDVDNSADNSTRRMYAKLEIFAIWNTLWCNFSNFCVVFVCLWCHKHVSLFNLEFGDLFLINEWTLQIPRYINDKQIPRYINDKQLPRYIHDKQIPRYINDQPCQHRLSQATTPSIKRWALLAVNSTRASLRRKLRDQPKLARKAPKPNWSPKCCNWVIDMPRTYLPSLPHSLGHSQDSG